MKGRATRPHGDNQLDRTAKQRAEERLRLWRFRGLCSIAAFVLSCAALYMFLYGQPLHRYWDSFGKYLIFPCEGLLLVMLYCVILWWAAWRTSK